MTNFTPSNELNTYIRIRIGESKSKEEEDKWVTEDVESLREDIARPSLPDKKQWEVILRIIYAEMLGHDTRFSHSFVVSCVQNPNYRVKRIAYVACMLLLDEDSPFRIMMVASIQKDLQNNCLYNKIISLNALPKMICPMNAAAFIELLAKHATNPQQIVRKKTLLALIQLEKSLPDAVEKFQEVMEKGLRDPDASVMMAVLPFYLEDVRRTPAKHRHLLDVFLKILTQIVDKKLPRDYEYENHGAPWAIISLFKILGALCGNDKGLSERIYQFLENFIKSFFVLMTDVDLVVLYEALQLVLRIYPSDNLMGLVIEKIDLIERSLVMKKQDRAYLTLQLISAIVERRPKLPGESHLLILQSLESPDETIRQVAIDILFKTANEQNVEKISERIENYITITADLNVKARTIARYYDLLQNKSPDGQWFLKRALYLLSIGQGNVSIDIVNKLIGSIQEIVTYSEDEKPVDQLLVVFEDHFAAHPVVDPLAQVFAWFIGAYIFRANNLADVEAFALATFDYLLSQQFELETTYCFIYTALSKLKVKRNSPEFAAKVNELMSRRKTDECTQANLRIRQYLKLTHKDLWKVDEQIDPSLSFLESYVRKQVFKGAKVYNPNALTELSRPQKQTESLVIKYTKDQLEKNMKKIIQTNESEFVYSGKGKWKAEGYQKEQKEEKSADQVKPQPLGAYVGVSSDDFGGSAKIKNEPRPAADLRQTLNADQDGDRQKVVTNMLGKDTRKVDNKTEKKRAQMAASLFGGSDDLFKGGFSSKNNYFSSSGGKDSSQGKKDYIGSQAGVPKPAGTPKMPSVQSPATNPSNTGPKPATATNDTSDFDLLGMGGPAHAPKPATGDTPLFDLTRPQASVKLRPNPINLEKYEELWDKLEQKESSFERKSTKNSQDLQKWLGSLHFAVIEADPSEVVSSALTDTNEPALLYANIEDDRTIKFIFRGPDSAKQAVLARLKEISTN